MEKKTLFEIPIYSMSKKEFNRRWDKQKQKLHDTYVSHGHSEEDTQYYVSRFSFPRSLWEYNQIMRNLFFTNIAISYILSSSLYEKSGCVILFFKSVTIFRLNTSS